MEPAHFLMLSLYLFAPSLIGRYVVRGTWRQVFAAYCIWIVLLALLGMMIGGPHGAGYGWALLFAMFTTIVAVPILVGIVRWRERTKSTPAR